MCVFSAKVNISRKISYSQLTRSLGEQSKKIHEMRDTKITVRYQVRGCLKHTWCTPNQPCTCILCIYELLNVLCVILSSLRLSQKSQKFINFFYADPVKHRNHNGESCDGEGATIIALLILALAK